MKKHDMINGRLSPQILMFSLPLALTGILQQLFNAADIAVVGQCVGKTAMAAVGSNSPVIGILVNLFVGISLGTNVVIARFTGQGNKKGIENAVHTAVLVALLGGTAIGLLGELIAQPLLTIMLVPDDVMEMAVSYLRIYCLGLPVIFLYNFESAIFRSKGNTKTPLFCLAVSGVVNVGLNLYFVCIAGMKVEGVALATVISNAVSSLLLFIMLVREKGDIHLDIKKLRIHKSELLLMLRIGIPSGLQGMVFTLSNICVQSGINSLGSDIMAASSAAFNIEIFAFYIINSFGQACTTFIGQNHGANKPERCRQITKICMLQDMIAALLTSGITLLLGRFLLSLFNGDPVVVEYGYVRLLYIITAEVINVVMEIISGSLRGYGRSLAPALVTLFGVCGTRIGWIYTVFAANSEFNILMIVYPLSWAVTAASLLVVYFIITKIKMRDFFSGSAVPKKSRA